ncbi:hypothetical protein DNHGIG_14290 [Collibacillus ludicampi]|jgi:hypothetical protein|uniref:YkuS family protein n=1 Tax=Collibacillus ludicampi TaxID=2771369 RepID=A0AAV4LDI2_9BACL|nr:YkuS family protein [Collibacillus ludicampi]GIM45880.1 hypothetical protein DNHGIG_14290 [Collibacillus ludicampi]
MKVAVEANLSPVREYLSRQGYQVDTLDANQLENLGETQANYSAVVISGADQNLTGIQNVVVNCPIINAHGMTPEEIHQRIQAAGK